MKLNMQQIKYKIQYHYLAKIHKGGWVESKDFNCLNSVQRKTSLILTLDVYLKFGCIHVFK